ncbi:MAG: FAD-dependent 5-carboxymethylaminomethyl-2-thiouridine(34) oxidoreductase MnmC [Shewanella sp.]|nr:FAD-dependent 5-carboxymethylaminomethyl-2-thiouridine(34) oxidoreductase MnmC [Shewanella sp.]MCF1431994.1 FAD-dependent 5-carboxymethylaminomethyl-2-thiouridine(34) oxidoreductase MnmC [Shewanella sp.]MCF1458993.1 FAD-dependent 5-carboxymethylaminomethyl-2-thiouridine(34) oxidoreductase MnmC [Shewanella sp.]
MTPIFLARTAQKVKMFTISELLTSISHLPRASVALLCQQDLSALAQLIDSSRPQSLQLTCYCLSTSEFVSPGLPKQEAEATEKDTLHTPRHWLLESGRISLSLYSGLNPDKQEIQGKSAHSLGQLGHQRRYDGLVLADDVNQSLLADARLLQDAANLARSPADITLLKPDDGLKTQLNNVWGTTQVAQTEKPLMQTSVQASPTTDSAYPQPGMRPGTVAIIGGGIASAALCLSLAERGQRIKLFCRDAKPAQGASGNRQGALYPQLSHDHCLLSQFYVQSFLYSRHRLVKLLEQGHDIAHGLCGVLQTAHDDKSAARLNKVMRYPWPQAIATRVDATRANQLAGIAIDKSGLYYPQGAWVCPAQYTNAMLMQAAKFTDFTAHFETDIQAIEQGKEGWYLHSHSGRFGPFANLVIASGAELTTFAQTKSLQLSPFRGQISHVPTSPGLSRLSCVLCAEGYMTPAHDLHHCIGASYVKGSKALNFSEQEQQDNLQRMCHSYSNADWTNDIDVSDNRARVGVRMVSRDHFPMMGAAPDIDGLLELAYTHPQDAIFWQQQPAPVHDGLFVLGGFGSRGVCSAPLTAEALAAQLCSEPSPFNQSIRERLNPNRMWMRKLLKGKPL